MVHMHRNTRDMGSAAYVRSTLSRKRGLNPWGFGREFYGIVFDLNNPVPGKELNIGVEGTGGVW